MESAQRGGVLLGVSCVAAAVTAIAVTAYTGEPQFGLLAFAAVAYVTPVFKAMANLSA